MLQSALFGLLALAQDPIPTPPGPPLATLEVTVVDEDGDPVPEVYMYVSMTEEQKAVLRSAGLDPETCLSGRSDGEGQRQLCLFAGDDQVLKVGGIGGLRSLASREVVEVPDLEPDEVRDLRVSVKTRPDSSYRGVVLDAETGEPAAGVQVFMERTIGSSSSSGFHRLRLDRPADGESDESGGFEVATHTWCDDYATFVLPGRYMTRISLEELIKSDTTEIKLRKTGRVEGVIYGMYSDETRIRAIISIYDMAKPLRSGSGFTSPVPFYANIEPDGSFAFPGLPSDVSVKLQLVDGREILREWHERIKVGPGGVHVVEWEPPREVSIRGTVRTPEGEPVQGQYVSLFQGERASSGLLSNHYEP